MAEEKKMEYVKYVSATHTVPEWRRGRGAGHFGRSKLTAAQPRQVRSQSIKGDSGSHELWLQRVAEMGAG